LPALQRRCSPVYTNGIPPLLSKIAALIKKSHNRIVSPETEILITAGATQGILLLYKL
jgi:aspartate/methionine/tyrosine aminotransferase